MHQFCSKLSLRQEIVALRVASMSHEGRFFSLYLNISPMLLRLLVNFIRIIKITRVGEKYLSSKVLGVHAHPS